MELVYDEIFRAFGYLLIVVFAFFAWKTALDNSKDGNFKKVLWKGLLLCTGIALFASLTLGNPTCEVQSDPVYGDCEQYADDGFEPTTEQKLANFVFFMVFLYTPVVFGAFSGNKLTSNKE